MLLNKVNKVTLDKDEATLHLISINMFCLCCSMLLKDWGGKAGRGGGRRAHLLFYVGVGGSQQPVDLRRQISAHLCWSHAGQRAQSQRLDILVAVEKVAGKHTKMKTHGCIEDWNVNSAHVVCKKLLILYAFYMLHFSERVIKYTMLETYPLWCH